MLPRQEDAIGKSVKGEKGRGKRKQIEVESEKGSSLSIGVARDAREQEWGREQGHN